MKKLVVSALTGKDELREASADEADARAFEEAYYDVDLRRDKALAAAKERARLDIIDLYPEWKQRNMIAEALEEIVGQLDTLNVRVDKSKIKPAVDAWEYVKARRLQSDAEEEEVWDRYPV